MYYLLYNPYKKFNQFIIVGTNDEGVTNKLSLISKNPNSTWGTFEETLWCTEVWDDDDPEDFATWFRRSNYTLIAQSTILPFSTVLSGTTTYVNLQEKYPKHFI